MAKRNGKAQWQSAMAKRNGKAQWQSATAKRNGKAQQQSAMAKRNGKARWQSAMTKRNGKAQRAQNRAIWPKKTPNSATLWSCFGRNRACGVRAPVVGHVFVADGGVPSDEPRRQRLACVLACVRLARGVVAIHAANGGSVALFARGGMPRSARTGARARSKYSAGTARWNAP